MRSVRLLTSIPLWFILPTTYWLVKIGSSVGKNSCARVPPIVPSNAMDGAGYLPIILGVFDYEYTDDISLFDYTTGYKAFSGAASCPRDCRRFPNAFWFVDGPGGELQDDTGAWGVALARGNFAYLTEENTK